MKVFLDDQREAPDGWVRAHWPDEVIALLKKGLSSNLGDRVSGNESDKNFLKK